MITATITEKIEIITGVYDIAHRYVATLTVNGETLTVSSDFNPAMSNEYVCNYFQKLIYRKYKVDAYVQIDANLTLTVPDIDDDKPAPQIEAPAVEPEQEQLMEQNEPSDSAFTMWSDATNLTPTFTDESMLALIELAEPGVKFVGSISGDPQHYEPLITAGFAIEAGDENDFYQHYAITDTGRQYVASHPFDTDAAVKRIAANDEQATPKFQQGQRVKITNINRPRFGQVGEIMGYDPAQKLYNVLFGFSSSDYTEDELMLEWTPGSGTHPVLDMLSKLNIDALSPIEAYTKLYELKRLL